jgi:hypothetical protein
LADRGLLSKKRERSGESMQLWMDINFVFHAIVQVVVREAMNQFMYHAFAK